MSRLDLETVIARTKAKQSGSEWHGHCPAHDDQRSSLSIRRGDSVGVVLKCHAGCDYHDIVKALGLTNGTGPALPPRALAVPRAPRRVVDRYDYTDERGALLYQEVRFDPKDFRLRRPDGHGGWVENISGVPRVWYRLPQLNAAVAAGRGVVIAEGAKDANRLHELGMVGTTVAGGASARLPDEWTAPFRGARVVILPHNDDAGRKHADRLARGLLGVASSVKVVALPGVPEKGGDLSNWCDAGGTREQLNALIAAATDYRASSATAAKPAPPSIAESEGTVEPWSEPVDNEALFEAVAKKVAEYVVLGTHEQWAITLWVLHTYCIEAFDVTPYLWVHSPTRECGKSTLLDLLHQLAHRAERTDGITAAALYRRIDRLSPTMLLDELDTQLKLESGEALRGVLNSGYTRSGRRTVCVAKGKVYDEQEFKTFCPKVLAGIGRLWDTVVSRSIPIRMERATRKDKLALKRLRLDRIRAECLELRRKMLRFALDHVTDLRECDPFVPDSLGSRQADVWRPLLAIADVAGGYFPAIARDAAVGLQGKSGEDGDWGMLLLEDLRALAISLFPSVTTSQTGGSKGGLATQAILEHLHKLPERPWPEYRHGQPISTRGLATLLGRFDVHSQTIRVDAAKTAKGYPLDALMRACERYLPPPSCDVVTDANGDMGPGGQGGLPNDLPQQVAA